MSSNFISKLTNKYKALPIVAKASFWFIICNVLQQGISVLMTPVFTRLLSTEDYGTWSVFLAWESIISIIATINLAGGGFINCLIKYKDDQDAVVSSLVVLLLGLTSIWVGVYFLLEPLLLNVIFLPRQYILMIFVDVFFKMVFALWSGKERYNYKYVKLIVLTLITTIVTQAVSAILVYFLPNKLDMRIYTSVGIPSLCYLIILVFLLIKGRCLFKWSYWKYMLLFNILLVPHYLSQIILNQSDRIMIDNLCGANYSAYYSVSYTIANVMLLVLNGVFMAISPWFLDHLDKKIYEGINDKFTYLAIVFAFLVLIPILIGPEIILLLAPAEYQEAKWILPPVACSIYFLFLYNVYTMPQFFYEKKIFITISSVLAAGLNVGLNFLFIPIYGFVAAGYTTLICYVIYALCNIIYCQLLIKKYSIEKQLFNNKLLIIFGIAITALSLLCNFLYLNDIVRYVIIGVLFLLLIIFTPKTIRFFKNFKKEKDNVETT